MSFRPSLFEHILLAEQFSEPAVEEFSQQSSAFDSTYCLSSEPIAKCRKLPQRDIMRPCKAEHGSSEKARLCIWSAFVLVIGVREGLINLNWRAFVVGFERCRKSHAKCFIGEVDMWDNGGHDLRPDTHVDSADQLLYFLLCWL